MAYTATYASGDLGPIAIDGIGAIGVAGVSLAGLIGLVMVYRWFKGKSLGL